MTGGCIFKIDFRRTYDLVDWNFLDKPSKRKVWITSEDLGLGIVFEWLSTILTNGKAHGADQKLWEALGGDLQAPFLSFFFFWILSKGSFPNESKVILSRTLRLERGWLHFQQHSIDWEFETMLRFKINGER